MSLGPLAPLAAWRQFVVVMLVPLANGKTNKLPIRHDTLAVCDAHDPTAWTDYATAAGLAALLGASYCVGFVLTANDPFFCLDIDSCAEPGKWSDLSQQLRAHLPGTVTEVSQSNGGMHLWGRRSAMPAHTMKNIALHIELYSSLRFIALGHSAIGEMAEDCTAIDAVAAAYFPPREKTAANTPNDGPRADWLGPADDAELLRRAMMSKSAGSVFGTKASFADLWHADEHVLSKAYPADASNSEPYDRSSADAALSQHLAFWTGCDVARIERLMRQSALARDKWDDRRDYLVERTIMGACGMQRDVLQDKPVALPEPLVPAAPLDATRLGGAVASEPPKLKSVEGRTMLSPEEQMVLFDGCIYIEDSHRVLVPGGRLRKPDQFRAKFGGYSFAMGGDGNSKVTRNAWEAFSESQAFRAPRADETFFDPLQPYGTIVVEGGRRLANQYWPVDVPCVEGDTGPFDRHLAKLFPDPRDRLLAMVTLASLVQYVGHKLPWAAVIQGVEGNGKTFLSRCIARAVSERYTFWPTARKLTGNFNAFLYGHVFFAVEDIHTDGNADVFEMMKPLIAGGGSLEIEAKGVDQTSRRICGNFLFNTNHKNALKKTANDRRILNLNCAQQSVEDLIRDGMDDAYMHDLHGWADNGGYAHVTYLLRNFAIPPELDPTKGAKRAPTSSSTADAIASSLGPAEQHVVEAIEQDLPGFRGGWVSSHFLDLLLERVGKGRAVPITRRRDLMRSLGYDWHPAFTGGRTNNQVMPDGTKPRLYIKAGHPDRVLTSADAARAYALAQGVKA